MKNYFLDIDPIDIDIKVYNPDPSEILFQDRYNLYALDSGFLVINIYILKINNV